MNKILITIKNIKEIDHYKNIGINAFVFPVGEYSIGFDKYFTIAEVNDLKLDNSYIIFNRILDCNDVDSLKKIDNFKHIKGIIFDDLAVFNIFKNRNLELIYLNSHFNTNTLSINYWLKEGIDEVVLSNEITKEEIKDIVDNIDGMAIVQVFGLNMAMYSRRTLISNYNKFYNMENEKLLDIRSNNNDFIVLEEEKGTVIFNKNIYNAMELIDYLNNDKIKYFYINTSFIDNDIIYKILNGDKIDDIDTGFLYKETIYKLGEKNND